MEWKFLTANLVKRSVCVWEGRARRAGIVNNAWARSEYLLIGGRAKHKRKAKNDGFEGRIHSPTE